MQILPVDSTMIGSILEVASRADFERQSPAENAKGFLFPYTSDEYENFSIQAEYFYAIREGAKVMGFVLAHSGSLIPVFGGEVYLELVKRYAPTLVIRQVCVRKDAVRLNFGRKLYDYLFEVVRQRTSAEVAAFCFIWKEPANPASEAFHSKLGWQMCATYSLKKSPDAHRKKVGIWNRMLP